MLLFTVGASFWLEIFFKVRVLARFIRLLFSVLPVAFLYLVWDAYAISRKHWQFDKEQISGIYAPFNIPLEEVLFFLIVPCAAVMTIEAVRTRKKDWVVRNGSSKEK